MYVGQFESRSVSSLCSLLGYSRQAFYRFRQDAEREALQHDLILQKVLSIRKTLKRIGTRKLLFMMQNFMLQHNIQIGRDALFDLLRYRGLLVRKTKRFHFTTNSKHFYYTSPNRIKELEINHSEQVFVSDITYIKTDEGHAYLALVTEAYSKKIMGWSFDDNMKVSMVKDAMTMAYNNCKYGHKSIIHHSDRGMQYCCPDYTEFAKKKGFIMSTTKQSDPYENAIVERINGILKY